MNASGDPLDWERLESLFEAVSDLSEPDRAAFLDRECPDPDQRSELESLLASAASGEQLFETLSASAFLSSDPLLGQSVGHYSIEGRLGGGGVGVVYRARDTRLGRVVALKFLPQHLELDPRVRERFTVEARAAAALDHPNICTVHEIGETEEGRPFIAMAHYEGETLRDRIARGPLPVPEAVAIATVLARALAAAHAQGIVHRDVKPANVMLPRDGGVKLVDFGLAKVADVTLTLPGVTPGTVAYMSPERIRSNPVDARTDLWSLGVVLHEMIAGVRPFPGDDERVVSTAILYGDPVPLETVRPEVPDRVGQAVRRLLQKDPAARFGSAEALLTGLVPGDADGPRGVVWPRMVRRSAAAVGLVLIARVGWLFFSSGPVPADPPSAAPEVRTVAVLPFTNLGGDPDQEYLSDGLTEELIAALTRFRGVRVAARTSAFAFKGDSRDIREIGRTLNVGAILEGSVQNQGDRIRVAARLVSVADGFQLWSASYERRMTDVFAIERDIALQIATALAGEPTPAARAALARKPTESPEAHTLYLKGRYFWNQRTRDGFARAVEYFQRAIETDSGYARAYAGLANAYGPMGLFGYLHPGRARELFRNASYRAVELDSESAEAQTALGSYLNTHGWDPTGAEQAFLRAIELDPDYPTAHHMYGYFLTSRGRFEEALVQRRLAVKLDPLVPVHIVSVAGDLSLLGQRALAAVHYRETLEIDPGFWLAHEYLGLMYETYGEGDEAVSSFRRAVAFAGSTPRPRAGLARVLALTGQEAEARRILDALLAEAKRDSIYTPQVASVLYALGDQDTAFEWLEAAYRQRHPDLQHVALMSGVTGLVRDPRFADLLRRIGLPLLYRAPGGPG